MIAAGVIVGVGVALAAGRVIVRVVEGTRPTEVSTFAVMTAVLVAAALLASAVPARRAGHVDALQALRQE
jgi:ABC-type lipoprotein release transport system permease subunit